MRLLFILSILFLTGCTITKRHFGPGYHVEWKKHYSGTEKKTEKQENWKEEYVRASDPSNAISGSEILKDSIQFAEANSSDIPLDTDEQKTTNSEVQLKIKMNQSLISTKHISDDDVPIDQPKRKVEPLTWVALGGILFGIFLSLLSFLVTAPEIIWGVLFGLCILVMVCTIVSVIRVIKHPEKYKGKGLTWTLFGLTLVGILAILFMIVYLILLLTHNADFL